MYEYFCITLCRLKIWGSVLRTLLTMVAVESLWQLFVCIIFEYCACYTVKARTVECLMCKNGQEVQVGSIWQFFQTISEFCGWSCWRSVMCWRFCDICLLQTNFNQNKFLLLFVGSLTGTFNCGCCRILYSVDFWSITQNNNNQLMAFYLGHPGWACTRISPVSLIVPLPSNRQHLSNDNCMEDKREDYETFCPVLCSTVVHIDTHTHEEFLQLTVGLDLGFLKIRVAFCMFFAILFLLFASDVLGLVSSDWLGWLGRTSPKWPTLCQVGRKTLTQSINQPMSLISFIYYGP